MCTSAVIDVLKCNTRYTHDWEVHHGHCYRGIEAARGLSNQVRPFGEINGTHEDFLLTEALAAEIDRLEYEYGLMKKVEDYRAGRLETVTLDELEENLGLAD